MMCIIFANKVAIYTSKRSLFIYLIAIPNIGTMNQFYSIKLTGKQMFMKFVQLVSDKLISSWWAYFTNCSRIGVLYLIAQMLQKNMKFLLMYYFFQWDLSHWQNVSILKMCNLYICHTNIFNYFLNEILNIFLYLYIHIFYIEVYIKNTRYEEYWYIFHLF